ncbi:NAD(P)H-binding protein [Kocuria rhizophila]|nr:NAD(P)H-binding protein [Kocuria rhizophila]
MIEGDGADAAALGAALQGQDVVYANLGGAEHRRAGRGLVSALDAAGVKRLPSSSRSAFTHELPEASRPGTSRTRRRAGGLPQGGGRLIRGLRPHYTIIRPALADEQRRDRLTSSPSATSSSRAPRLLQGRGRVHRLRRAADPSTHSRQRGRQQAGHRGRQARLVLSDQPLWRAPIPQRKEKST